MDETPDATPTDSTSTPESNGSSETESPPAPQTSEPSQTETSTPPPPPEQSGVSSSCGTVETPCVVEFSPDWSFALSVGVALALVALFAVLAAQLRRP